jgi:hypothetical protein
VYDIVVVHEQRRQVRTATAALLLTVTATPSEDPVPVCAAFPMTWQKPVTLPLSAIPGDPEKQSRCKSIREADRCTYKYRKGSPQRRGRRRYCVALNLARSREVHKETDYKPNNCCCSALRA